MGHKISRERSLSKENWESEHSSQDLNNSLEDKAGEKTKNIRVILDNISWDTQDKNENERLLIGETTLPESILERRDLQNQSVMEVIYENRILARKIKMTSNIFELSIGEDRP